MKIVGLMLVRNEAWCLGLSLRAAAKWCDALVVIDHASTDATNEIIRQWHAHELGSGSNRLRYVRVEEDAWDEMDVRQRSLEIGRSMGATHLAIIDADEVLSGNLLGAVRPALGKLMPGEACSLPMISTYNSLTHRRYDGPWGERSRITLAWADSPAVLGWARDGDGYQHHMRTPRGCPTPPGLLPGYPKGSDGWWSPRGGGVFHLQFFSPRRLRAKSAWYKMIETVRWPGRMSARALNEKYDWTLSELGVSIAPIPPEWWEPYKRELEYLDRSQDAEDWREAKCREMIEKHGRETFAGLNLHGVV